MGLDKEINVSSVARNMLLLALLFFLAVTSIYTWYHFKVSGFERPGIVIPGTLFVFLEAGFFKIIINFHNLYYGLLLPMTALLAASYLFRLRAGVKQGVSVYVGLKGFLARMGGVVFCLALFYCLITCFNFYSGRFIELYFFDWRETGVLFNLFYVRDREPLTLLSLFFSFFLLAYVSFQGFKVKVPYRFVFSFVTATAMGLFIINQQLNRPLIEILSKAFVFPFVFLSGTFNSDALYILLLFFAMIPLLVLMVALIFRAGYLAIARLKNMKRLRGRA